MKINQFDIESLIKILEDFGSSIDPHGSADGDYGKAIIDLIKFFEKK